MIAVGTLCEIVGTVAPQYQCYLGRFCVVTGYRMHPLTGCLLSTQDGVIHTIDITDPDGPGATRRNLRPIVPPGEDEGKRIDRDIPTEMSQ